MKHKFGLLLSCLFLLTLGASAQDKAPTLTEVLKGNIVDGKVDYDGIRKNRKAEMDAFVKGLATADLEKMEKSEQVAFWLDAYNGLVIYQVIQKDAAPDSRKARSKFFRGRRYMVAGKERTLDDIEHKALRPLAKDPRVHFVLVCGAASCPPLKASAFLSENDLDTTLEAATKSYINNPDNVTIDAENKKLVLNKIFDWYKGDFGDVVDYVSRYHNDGQQLKSGDWDIEYRKYSWTLNEAEG